MDYQTKRVQYTASASQNLYVIPFTFDPSSQTGGLDVYYCPPNTAAAPSQLVVGWVIDNPSPNVFQVDLTGVIPGGVQAGAVVTIVLDMDPVRITTFGGNSFPYSALNNEFDRVYLLIAELLTYIFQLGVNYIPNAILIGTYPGLSANTLPTLPASSVQEAWTNDPNGNIELGALSGGSGGVITMAGDDTGPSNANRIAKLQGVPLNVGGLGSSSCFIAFDSTHDQIVGIPSSGDITTGTITGSSIPLTVTGLGGLPLTINTNSGYLSVPSLIAWSATENKIANYQVNGSGSDIEILNDTTSGTLKFKVKGIQGIPVSMTAPTTNQVLSYNGTQYVPTTFSASGAVSYFSALNSVGQNIPSSPTQLNFSTVLLNVNNNYNGSTSIWTCTTPGDYTFSVGGNFSISGGSGAGSLTLLKNNFGTGASGFFSSTNSNTGASASTGPITMAAGDTMSVSAIQSTSVSVSFFNGIFSANLIRAA